MRYDLQPSTKCYIFSVGIEEMLYKENFHVFNNSFKMKTLKHVKAR